MVHVAKFVVLVIMIMKADILNVIGTTVLMYCVLFAIVIGLLLK